MEFRANRYVNSLNMPQILFEWLLYCYGGRVPRFGLGGLDEHIRASNSEK